MRYAVWSRVDEHPAGWPAIFASLAAMRRLAREASTDPTIQAWAIGAVAGARSELEAAGALLARVRRDARFMFDPDGVDLVQHPLFTLARGRGDCDCLSSLFAAGALALGFAVRFIVGARPGVEVATHVLPAVEVGGAWLPAEVSSRRLPLGRYPPRFVPSGQVTL